MHRVTLQYMHCNDCSVCQALQSIMQECNSTPAIHSSTDFCNTLQQEFCGPLGLDFVLCAFSTQAVLDGVKKWPTISRMGRQCDSRSRIHCFINWLQSQLHLAMYGDGVWNVGVEQFLIPYDKARRRCRKDGAFSCPCLTAGLWMNSHIAEGFNRRTIFIGPGNTWGSSMTCRLLMSVWQYNWWRYQMMKPSQFGNTYEFVTHESDAMLKLRQMR